MARAHDDDILHPERTDGALRCRLCTDSTPRMDNDWCGVAQGVLCEDCCRALMMGEEPALDLVSHRRGRIVDREEVSTHCTSCERLIRLVSEHVLEHETDVRLPMH